MAFELNEKPWWVAALIGTVLGAAVYFIADYYVFEGIRKEKTKIQEKINGLDREIDIGRAAKANLPSLEDEIRNLELELDRLRRILPTKKETENLIKKLKQLTERFHFRMVSFRPQGFQEKDFYIEWPIRVELDGTYHQLGLLFAELSEFRRIINVTDVTISPLKSQELADMTIHATFTQRTFIYKE